MSEDPAEINPCTYLMPGDRRLLVEAVIDDVMSCRRRMLYVGFLPPCGKLGRIMAAGAGRLQPENIRFIVDGTTRESLHRFDAEWMQRRVKPGGGTIHAKVLVVDDIVWTGSWNFGIGSSRQFELMHRWGSAREMGTGFWEWSDSILLETEPKKVGTEARGAYADDPRSGPVEAPEGSNYDSDLGF